MRQTSHEQLVAIKRLLTDADAGKDRSYMRAFAFTLMVCSFSAALYGLEYDPNSPKGKAAERELAEAKAAWQNARHAEHAALRQALRNEKGMNTLVEWDKRSPGQAAELTQFLLEKKGRNIPDFCTQKKAEAAGLKRCHSLHPEPCRAFVLWIRQYPDAARELFKIKDGLGWAMETAPATNHRRSADDKAKAPGEEKKELRGPQSAQSESAKKSSTPAAKAKSRKNDDDDADDDDDDDDDQDEKDKDKKTATAGAKKSDADDEDDDDDDDEDDKDGKKTDKKKKKKVTAKSVLDWVKEKIE